MSVDGLAGFDYDLDSCCRRGNCLMFRVKLLGLRM